MKPIPAEQDAKSDTAYNTSAPLSASMSSYLGSGSGSNRKTPKSSLVIKAYPWLLLSSTATAAFFFFLYITKPVIVDDDPSQTNNPAAVADQNPNGSGILPNANRLPGDGSPSGTVATKTDHRHLTPPVIGKFEETNLRMQHILSAEAPSGFTGRIDVEVPVLYQSRQLRWTPEEVTEARSLLTKLTEHQSKARQLRSEGSGLLKSWNQLVEKSLPSTHLRADSPSAPANQHSTMIADSGSNILTEPIKPNSSEE